MIQCFSCNGNVIKDPGSSLSSSGVLMVALCSHSCSLSGFSMVCCARQQGHMSFFLTNLNLEIKSFWNVSADFSFFKKISHYQVLVHTLVWKKNLAEDWPCPDTAHCLHWSNWSFKGKSGKTNNWWYAPNLAFHMLWNLVLFVSKGCILVSTLVSARVHHRRDLSWYTADLKASHSLTVDPQALPKTSFLEVPTVSSFL